MTVRNMLVIAAFFAALTLNANAVNAQEAENKSLADAIKSGEAHVGFRYLTRASNSQNTIG